MVDGVIMLIWAKFVGVCLVGMQVGILVPCSRSPIGLACSVLSQIRHQVLNAFAAPRGYAFKPVLTFAVAVGVSSDPITSG